MKKYQFLLLPVLVLIMAACQDPNNPDPVPAGTSFPRKHLIDHFTGETCPNCPPAMKSIQALVDKNPDKYIWVSHHCGYYEDEYTVKASKSLLKMFPEYATKGATYAPAMAIDRTKRRVGGTNSYVFSPLYLDDNAVPLKDADTSLVQVLIDHTYDAATRELKVAVHGQTLDPEATGYKVTVLIKESNLIGKQADQYYSWAGWDEFRHVKTVRAFLTTNDWGDEVSVTVSGKTRSYALDTITYKIPAKWDDTNCTIVAYVTPNSTTDYTVLNAEQVALVKGTKGGEQYIYEGIKAVAVPDDYPEEGAPLSTIEFTACKVNTQYLASNGLVSIVLQAPDTKVNAGGYASYPYMQLYVFTQTANLADGTYPFVQDQDKYDYGMVVAGYKDEENFEIGGSMLYYVYNYSGGLYPMAQWLLVTGELVVNNGNYTITATTLNGSNFTATYNGSAASAPARNTEEIPTLWKIEKKDVCLSTNIVL